MIVGLGMFELSLSQFPDDIVLARSVTLTTSILFQLFLALSTRSKSPVVLQSPLGNPWLLGAVTLSAVAQIILIYSPLSILFSVKAIPVILWEEIVLSSLLAFVIFEILKTLKNLKKGS
jgi:magnesium-transporting ATPase (P-type)